MRRLCELGNDLQETTQESLPALGLGKSFAIRYSCMQSAGDAYKD